MHTGSPGEWPEIRCRCAWGEKRYGDSDKFMALSKLFMCGRVHRMLAIDAMRII